MPDIGESFIHESAIVDDNVEIGEGTAVWHFVHLLEGTRIGAGCVIGQNVMIGPNVTVGRGCRIQNNVSLYYGVEVADEVFLGPSMVFTNVRTPRANVDRKLEFEKTHVGRGASLGANCTIICGTTIGEYAMVGAGAVVTKDVPPYAMVLGTPARQCGWVGRAGERLGDDLTCPRTGERYVLGSEGLKLASDVAGSSDLS